MGVGDQELKDEENAEFDLDLEEIIRASSDELGWCGALCCMV